MDALKVLEAVRIGRLPQVQRRLTDAERVLYVRSGSVFVWEESEDDTGIKRWTDGVVWSQSRMREPFLFYEEKVSAPLDERRATNPPPLARDSQDSSSPFRASPTFNNRPQSAIYLAANPAAPDQQPHTADNLPPLNGGLVKQAYSAYVTNPDTGTRKKFHLTAYFLPADLPYLPSVDSQPELRSVIVPQGIYRSGKSRTSARNLVQSAEPARVSLPFRHTHAAHNGSDSSSTSASSSPVSTHSSHLAPWAGPVSSSAVPLPLASSGQASYHHQHQHQHHHHLQAHNHNHPTPASQSSLVASSIREKTDLDSYMIPSDTQIHAYTPRLPAVSSLFPSSQSDSLRSAEDSRVIQMLNSRHIL